MQLFVRDALAATDTTPPAADTTATAGGTQAPGTEVPYDLSPEKMMRDNLLILGLIFFIFYFLLIRPQQQRVKMQKEMLKGLAKGNKVQTSGGLIGTVIKFDGDDVVIIEIAQGVRVRVARQAISEVVSEKAAPGESANDN